MHRRVQKKLVIAVMVLAAALPSLMTGCGGKAKSQDEELVCLTDEVSQEALEEEEKRDGQEEDVENSGIIYVHVCGQVACPGVYPLLAGSRLYEAIEAAGGILENGAGEWLNQAAKVGDGQRIYVPSTEEVRKAQQGGADVLQGTQGDLSAEQQGAQGSLYIAQQEIEGGKPSGQVSSSDDGKVNLNTASKEQLMTLSGIGEAKAASIIAYREEHGGFQKIEELMEVQGIKEGVFHKVRNQIRVN